MLKPQCGLQPGAVAEFSTEFAAAVVARGAAEYIVESKAGVKGSPVSNKRKAG